MARGDYSRRVRATSRDEVGELARAFNRMAADLEAADRERRELIANVSHELRTPIAALQAILENLVDGVTEPEPATLRTALAQTERLGRLVRELLDLSRIDAGTEPLDRSDVPVADVLEAAVAEAAMSRARTCGSPSTSRRRRRRRWADGARLHQVLANLLDNASRHSPPGGTVRVSASTGAAGLHLEVADDGPGIAPADRERVFDRFYRGGTSAPAAARTAPAAPDSAWPSPAGRSRCTAAGSPWPPADGTGCRFVVDLPARPEEAA